jgi:hypothetical protein
VEDGVVTDRPAELSPARLGQVGLDEGTTGAELDIDAVDTPRGQAHAIHMRGATYLEPCAEYTLAFLWRIDGERYAGTDHVAGSSVAGQRLVIEMWLGRPVGPDGSWRIRMSALVVNGCTTGAGAVAVVVGTDNAWLPAEAS